MTRDEHATDGPRFVATLREERAARLKGGLYHLNQIRLAYNSNHIEGSQLTEEQTRFIYETRTIDGTAPVDDIIETVNHFRLFDAMIDDIGAPLTADRLKDYHRILKAGTSDADRSWFALGGWKTRANTVGGQDTTPPEQVGDAIGALLAAVPESMTFEDICDFHAAFEAIHPFQDGNGRVGRIVMFGQCLSAGLTPFIVLESERLFYYRGLHEYADEPGYLRDTLRHFQDVYAQTYARYLPPVSVVGDGPSAGRSRRP